MKTSKLIQYGDLLILAFTMCIFRFGFLEQQPDLPMALNSWQFIVLIIGCLCIAAGGFLINNILGDNPDKAIEAEFGISEGKAYNLYAVLNIIGVGIGFYISNLIGKSGFALFFILVAATMYFYATNLKYTVIINNLIIALLISLVVLTVGIFNLYPVITPENKPYLRTVFSLFIDYGIFSFLIALIREIIKNLRDTDTDYNDGISTLPIAIGKNRAVKVVFVLTLIPVALLLYYGNTYVINLTWALIYGLIFILGPLVYFLISLWTAKTSKDFNRLSFILKLVLIFTALSITVITFNIQYNA